MNDRIGVWVALCAGAALISGCGSDSPTTPGSSSAPSTTISAPGLVSPANGSRLTGQVTLTVTNVTSSSGGTPTYTFQVASDSAFSSIVAQATSVPQGGGGQTSWTAGSQVASGQVFWRARASVGGTQGPFSAVGNFEFQGGPTTAGKTNFFD